MRWDANIDSRWLVIGGAVLIVITVSLAWVALSGAGQKLLLGQQVNEEAIEDVPNAVVASVIDGNTVELTDKRRVRYIGLDAPQKSECFASAATAENAKLVLGKKIRLEKDATNRDRLGHLLRYVYVSVDGGEIFLNQYLLNLGFAKVLNVAPDLYYEKQFTAAAEDAKYQQRGLWGACY